MYFCNKINQECILEVNIIFWFFLFKLLVHGIATLIKTVSVHGLKTPQINSTGLYTKEPHHPEILDLHLIIQPRAQQVTSLGNFVKYLI